MPNRTFDIEEAQSVVRALRRAFHEADLGHEERAIERGLVLAFNAIYALEDRLEKLERIQVRLLPDGTQRRTH